MFRLIFFNCNVLWLYALYVPCCIICTVMHVFCYYFMLFDRRFKSSIELVLFVLLCIVFKESFWTLNFLSAISSIHISEFWKVNNLSVSDMNISVWFFSYVWIFFEPIDVHGSRNSKWIVVLLQSESNTNKKLSCHTWRCCHERSKII